MLPISMQIILTVAKRWSEGWVKRPQVRLASDGIQVALFVLASGSKRAASFAAALLSRRDTAKTGDEMLKMGCLIQFPTVSEKQRLNTVKKRYQAKEVVLLFEWKPKKGSNFSVLKGKPGSSQPQRTSAGKTVAQC
jgi:hypothetical protein